MRQCTLEVFHRAGCATELLHGFVEVADGIRAVGSNLQALFFAPDCKRLAETVLEDPVEQVHMRRAAPAVRHFQHCDIGGAPEEAVEGRGGLCGGGTRRGRCHVLVGVVVVLVVRVVVVVWLVVWLVVVVADDVGLDVRVVVEEVDVVKVGGVARCWCCGGSQCGCRGRSGCGGLARRLS